MSELEVDLESVLSRYRHVLSYLILVVFEPEIHKGIKIWNRGRLKNLEGNHSGSNHNRDSNAGLIRKATELRAGWSVGLTNGVTDWTWVNVPSEASISTIVIDGASCEVDCGVQSASKLLSSLFSMIWNPLPRRLNKYFFNLSLILDLIHGRPRNAIFDGTCNSWWYWAWYKWTVLINMPKVSTVKTVVWILVI